MKILMLVNWKVERCSQPPDDRQPPDYVAEGKPYWFYRYFQTLVQVDVLDVSSFPALERLEKEKLRFYVLQALRAIPKMNRYDLVVSHGMQSGVVVSLFRRFFPGKRSRVKPGPPCGTKLSRRCAPRTRIRVLPAAGCAPSCPRCAPSGCCARSWAPARPAARGGPGLPA